MTYLSSVSPKLEFRPKTYWIINIQVWILSIGFHNTIIPEAKAYLYNYQYKFNRPITTHVKRSRNKNKKQTTYQ